MDKPGRVVLHDWQIVGRGDLSSARRLSALRLRPGGVLVGGHAIQELGAKPLDQGGQRLNAQPVVFGRDADDARTSSAKRLRAPRKLGCSTSTASPGPTKTLAARSMPCWQPLVTHTVDASTASRTLLEQCGNRLSQWWIAFGRPHLKRVAAARPQDTVDGLTQRLDGRKVRSGDAGGRGTPLGRLARPQEVAISAGRALAAAAAKGQRPARLERRQWVFFGRQWRRRDERAASNLAP